MTERAGSNVPQSKRVKFKTLVTNDSGPVGADEEVIDTQEEYDAWIAACTSSRDAFPKFDFGGQMLIAVSAGEHPMDGFRAQVSGIVEITGGIVGVQWQVLYRVLPRRTGHVTRGLTYPQHVVRTPRFEGLITFHQTGAPDMTTLAVGEEDPQGQPTTLAVGEENPQPTTLAVGEEGPHMTTLAIGEEQGGGQLTTLAVGEENQVTTLAVGEENPRPTTLAVGEEGPFGAY